MQRSFLRHLNLLAKLMVLLHQSLFHLAIAADAEAILVWISVEQVPSLHRIVPRYFKQVTSSNFMLISALMLFKLLVIILLFSVLPSIPYAHAPYVSLLVRSCSSPLLPLKDQCCQ